MARVKFEEYKGKEISVGESGIFHIGNRKDGHHTVQAARAEIDKEQDRKTRKAPRIWIGYSAYPSKGSVIEPKFGEFRGYNLREREWVVAVERPGRKNAEKFDLRHKAVFFDADHYSTLKRIYDQYKETVEEARKEVMRQVAASGIVLKEVRLPTVWSVDDREEREAEVIAEIQSVKEGVQK
jgi:hypothetical protein